MVAKHPIQRKQSKRGSGNCLRRRLLHDSFCCSVKCARQQH